MKLLRPVAYSWPLVTGDSIFAQQPDIMKKQLCIIIPDSPKTKPEPPKNCQGTPSDEEPIKHNHSIQSLSQQQSPGGYKPSSKAENYKRANNVVHFEEFKIDEPPLRNQRDTIKQIDTQMLTSKQEIDEANSPCKEPPAPSKGSSKTKVFAFPGQLNLKEVGNNSNMPLEKELQECKKQLLFKDGQISMLEKFISQHVGKHPALSNMKEVQKIILEKDQRIEELIEKIGELSMTVRQKSEEAVNLKYENYKLKSEISSLQNDIYMLTRKQSNQQSTRQFYELKKLSEQRQLGGGRFSLKHDPAKNIDDLQKRLNYLKTNNMELEMSKTRLNRTNKDLGWISQISQTSTNKEKRTIDFRLDTEGDRRKHMKHY